jgi:hypothetical protein
MSARRVRDISQHFSRCAVDHHDVRTTRNEDATGTGLGGQIIGAAFATNAELFNLERLRESVMRRAQTDGENNGWD